MKLKSLAAAVALASCATAHAAPQILGSMSFADGGLNVPSVPSSSIVSQLGVGLLNPVTQGVPGTFSCTGDFNLGAPCALAPAPTTGPINFATLLGSIYTYAGFTFDLSGITGIVRTPLASTGVGDALADVLAFTITGLVSGPGFAATPFGGMWTGQGACQGSAGTCLSNMTASWSASVTALPRIPEPSILALLGLGLGIIALRKTRDAR